MIFDLNLILTFANPIGAFVFALSGGIVAVHQGFKA